MKASKEACREAKERLDKLHKFTDQNDDIKFVRDFLDAAEKKLPREESFARDMNRDAGRKA